VVSDVDSASRVGPLLQMLQDPDSGLEVIGVKAWGLPGLTGYVECDGHRVRSLRFRSIGHPYFMSESIGTCPAKQRMSLSVFDNPRGSLQPIGPRDLFREFPKGSPLVCNQSLTHYYSRRSRAQGEADLVRLCESATVEESFYLFEGVNERGEKISFWYEVGIREELDNTHNSTCGAFFRGAAMDFARITQVAHYHIHPTTSDKSYNSHYPSPGDFEDVMTFAITDEPARLEFDAALYEERVVTAVGVYSAKPNFAKAASDPEGAREAIREYERLFEIFLDDVKGESIALAQTKKNRMIAELMTSSGFMKVKFTPFR